MRDYVGSTSISNKELRDFNFKLHLKEELICPPTPSMRVSERLVFSLCLWTKVSIIAELWAAQSNMILINPKTLPLENWTTAVGNKINFLRVWMTDTDLDSLLIARISSSDFVGESLAASGPRVLESSKCNNVLCFSLQILHGRRSHSRIWCFALKQFRHNFAD